MHCEPTDVADITYDDYSDENWSPSVRSCEPDIGRGRSHVRRWAYYKSLDKCYVLYFGDPIFKENENKFTSKLECNKVWRANVPRKYYKRSPTSSDKGDCSMVTYDPSFGSCKITFADDRKDKDENLFHNLKNCKSEWLAEDFRLCFNPAEKICKYSVNTSPVYKYNSRTQSCEKFSDGYCRGFQTSKHCYKRCG
ncbi:secreted protein, putative, partial [Ixodes scapularis]